MQYTLQKEVFSNFVDSVKKNHEFIAPVLKNRSSFKKIESSEEIYFKENTYFPVKGYFFKDREVLLEFDGNKITENKLKPNKKVIFGIRRCDLNGILHQEIVFVEEHPDPYFMARRSATILIGLHCKEGTKYCFCNSFELKDYFDLMFYDKGDFYAIEVGTPKGEDFIKAFKKFFKEEKNIITQEDKKIKNKMSLKYLNIARHYDNEKWKKGSDKCISCGACNFLCPNCHCFSIEDEVDFSLKKGKRIRTPASCQLRHFTRVAGDHVFRDAKLARFKHRIYHQMQYFKDRHDINFCTGCGRCIEGCPAKIDWVKIINGLH